MLYWKTTTSTSTSTSFTSTTISVTVGCLPNGFTSYLTVPYQRIVGFRKGRILRSRIPDFFSEICWTFLFETINILGIVLNRQKNTYLSLQMDILCPIYNIIITFSV